MGFDKNEDRVRVTNVKKNPSQYLALSTLEKKIGFDFIRTHLFTDYKSVRSRGVRRAVLTGVQEQVPATTENIELADWPQWATEVATAVKTLVADAAVNTDGFPMRELLRLDEALRRQRGALVDNLAKLRQLDGDIAQAEQELEGEEAANDPEKAPHTRATQPAARRAVIPLGGGRCEPCGPSHTVLSHPGDNRAGAQ